MKLFRKVVKAITLGEFQLHGFLKLTKMIDNVYLLIRKEFRGKPLL